MFSNMDRSRPAPGQITEPLEDRQRVKMPGDIRAVRICQRFNRNKARKGTPLLSFLPFLPCNLPPCLLLLRLSQSLHTSSLTAPRSGLCALGLSTTLPHAFPPTLRENF